MEGNPIKCKIVLVGDQSVGKTSIINRFIFDNFTGHEQVLFVLCSQPSESTSCPRPSTSTTRVCACSYGTPPARNVSTRSFHPTSRTATQPSSSTTSPVPLLLLRRQHLSQPVQVD